MKHLVCMMLTLALAVTAGAAQAADKVFGKPGVSLAIRDADEAACRQEARGATGSGAPSVYIAPSPQISPGAAMAGGVIGNAVAGAIEAERARSQAIDRCMKRAGYVYARLTAREDEAYDLMTVAERRVWLATFLPSDRGTEATRPLVPELPRGATDPAFTFVPGSVVLNPGPRRFDERVMTAKATVQALRLAAPFSYDGGKATAQAGTLFLPALINVPVSSSGGLSLTVNEPGWCGAATVGKGRVQVQVICLFDGNDGYRVVLAGPDRLSGLTSLWTSDKPRSQALAVPVAFEGPTPHTIEVRFDLRNPAGFHPDAVVGATTVDGRDFLVREAPAGGNGLIDLHLGPAGTVRLTPSGKGRSLTYAAVVLDEAVSKAMAEERERRAQSCGLNDLIGKMNRQVANGVAADNAFSQAELIAVTACVEAGAR